MRDNRVRGIVVVAAIAWIASTVVAAPPSSVADLQILGQAVLRFGASLTVAVIVAGVYRKHLWHWALLGGWLNTTPDIRGTWKVNLTTTYRDPTTNEAVPPIVGYMRVEQSETSLTMRLYTPSSFSRVVAYCLTGEGPDYELSAVYRNDPDIALQRDRSRPHDGAFSLRMISRRPTRLEGNYWTDRETAGTMVMTDRRAETIDCYQAGTQLFALGTSGKVGERHIADV